VLDADCRELKELFRPVIRQDLFENASYRLVSEAVSRLGQKYKVQVHPREINLFYMKDAHRERIVKTGEDEYQVLNTGIRFSRTEIEQEIEAWPERFSPNVVLRPLYQEQALPNIAMVGGPAEIAYWMEYKDMFEHYRIGFPLLILRNCFMWLDRKTYGKMEKMGVSPQDVFSETDTLIRRHLLRDGGVDLTEEKEELRSIFDRILKKAEAIDITLRASVEAERTRQLKRLGHQEDKLLRARKRKSEFTVKQLRDIRERLFPGGNLQERYDNFIPYFLNYGDSFFDMLKEQINPFSAHFQVLVPEE
jgi:bacillithiol synthase